MGSMERTALEGEPVMDADPLHQAAIAIIAAHALEWLKKSKLAPIMSQATPYLNHKLGLAIAWAAGIGISIGTNDYSWTGGGVIHIVMPMGSVLIDSVFHAAVQWGMQEGWYQSIVRPRAKRMQAKAAASSSPKEELLPK